MVRCSNLLRWGRWTEGPVSCPFSVLVSRGRLWAHALLSKSSALRSRYCGSGLIPKFSKLGAATKFPFKIVNCLLKSGQRPRKLLWSRSESHHNNINNMDNNSYDNNEKKEKRERRGLSPQGGEGCHLREERAVTSGASYNWCIFILIRFIKCAITAQTYGIKRNHDTFLVRNPGEKVGTFCCHVYTKQASSSIGKSNEQ